MIKSLRVRILAWYAISLTLTVASFGGFLYWRMRESRISEMDAELRGAGQSLLSAVNALHDFDFLRDKPLGTMPDADEFALLGPPPGARGGDRRGPRGFGGGPGGPGGRGGGPDFGGPGGPFGPGGPGGDRGFGGPGRGPGPGGREPELKGPPEEVFEAPAPGESEPKIRPDSEPKKDGTTIATSSGVEQEHKLAQDAGQVSRDPQRREGQRERGGRGVPWGGPGDHGPGDHGPGDRDHGPGGREFGGRGFRGAPGGGPGEFGFRGEPPAGFLEDLKEEFARKDRNVTVPANFDRGVEAIEGEKPYFAIWRENGTTLKASSTSPPQGKNVAKQLQLTSDGVIRSSGEYREIWIAGPHNSTILVRRKASKLYAELAQLLWGILGAGTAVLVVGMAGGWWMSYGVLKSIRAMNSEVSRLSEQNLSQRIGLRGVDTELSVLAKTLNRAFARLESAFDRQRQFTGDASHELRTPLTVVMGNLELALQDKHLGADAKRSLEAALRAAKRMRGLTDQLLMLARADAGALELKRSEFDFGDIVQECAELVRPMADKKHVRLIVEAPSTEMEGDAGLLSQVVINLLSNAIQYNKSGGDVHVGISDVGNAIQLEVTDTGVGIPEEARLRLFERFYRPDGSRNRASGGNGLGLAISKSLVEAHGGKITFDSAVGSGTEFRVLLPRC